MKRILLTTDFSENSLAAIPYAKEQMDAAGKDTSRLFLVNVLEDLAPTSIQFEFALATLDTKGILDKIFKQVTEKITALRHEQFEGYHCEAKVIRAEGSVASEIASFAKENDIDMIVMGTHGRAGLKRFMMGSIAEGIVHEASCPVLLIPNHGE